MTGWLDEDEQEPAVVHRSGAGASFLIVCDHAGRAIPRRLAGLGLPAAELDRHIAWDIGAYALAQRLSDALGATLVAQRYSRLVVDCNRAPGRADAVPEVSDGTPIPGNQGLDGAARRARFDAVHAPYHAAIRRELDRLSVAGARPALVSVHSFTPRMNGRDRPWRFGVLHEGGSRLSRAALAELAAEPDLAPEEIGDNQPYRMDEVDFTVPHHAIARGLDYLELEVRQDLIADDAGVEPIARRLARLLSAAAERAACAPARPVEPMRPG